VTRRVRSTAPDGEDRSQSRQLAALPPVTPHTAEAGGGGVGGKIERGARGTDSSPHLRRGRCREGDLRRREERRESSYLYGDKTR
jgi:hypothetical protein